MIQTRIILDTSTPLFKNLKKRGFVDGYRESIFIWLPYKPCIGELIEINSRSTQNEKFSTFLENRNKDLIFRIVDLVQYHMHLKTEKEGINILYLRCIEDNSINWYK